MALIYDATLQPTKRELLARWLPSQSWFTGSADVELVAAYRFDDPAGAVGIEVHLVRADEQLFHVPVTYRAQRYADAPADTFIGTTEHSVLGTRWVYDGCADPVCVDQLVAAATTGAPQAELWYDGDGAQERRDPNMRVHGSGTATSSPAMASLVRTDHRTTTVIEGDAGTLIVARSVGERLPDGRTLSGTWDRQQTPVPLAVFV